MNFNLFPCIILKILSYHKPRGFTHTELEMTVSAAAGKDRHSIITDYLYTC